VILRRTPLAGVLIVDAERQEDERGFFARTWCAAEFAANGMDPTVAQCSISFNHAAGTIRGIHSQSPPAAETKVVRCTAGRIYDVAVDLRPESATYLKWTAVELTAANRRALYLPHGVGHGFQTLEDESEVLYMISAPYTPGSARGVRWNDPALAIEWPLDVTVISRRDASYPDLPC
jgi:dTDP-4-dehydrorhamnose 3,5-epimerase